LTDLIHVQDIHYNHIFEEMTIVIVILFIIVQYIIGFKNNLKGILKLSISI